MDADDLRGLARRAANRTGYRKILVLGSQAVHGSLPGLTLPEIAMASEEADLVIVNDLSGDTPHDIEAHFGMGSPYHQSFGVYADGISLSEVSLPDGWEGRLRAERVDDGESDNPVTLLSPLVHDLCASKLIVAVTGGLGRRSDRAFVQALVDAGHVDLDLLDERIELLPITDQVRERVHEIVHSIRGRPGA